MIFLVQIIEIIFDMNCTICVPYYEAHFFGSVIYVCIFINVYVNLSWTYMSKLHY